MKRASNNIPIQQGKRQWKYPKEYKNSIENAILPSKKTTEGQVWTKNAKSLFSVIIDVPVLATPFVVNVSQIWCKEKNGSYIFDQSFVAQNVKVTWICIATTFCRKWLIYMFVRLFPCVCVSESVCQCVSLCVLVCLFMCVCLTVRAVFLRRFRSCRDIKIFLQICEWYGNRSNWR